MILCTLFPTLPAEAASQFHWKLITWKHRSRKQRIFSVEIFFFHKEAAELFIILLYCLFSLKKGNELILSHPPPHPTPSLKYEEN